MMCNGCTFRKGDVVDNIRLKARAKINIGLDVIRKREDGYHDMRMIMQTLSMYDRVDMQKIKGEEITIKTNLPYVPANENNLAYKAAKLLMDEFGIKTGVNIDIEKYIPVSAGMAGGSSDAAAVMIGVNKLFDLGLSLQELMNRSVKIGADVPYCIMRGTALAEGIGEKLTRLKPFPKCVVLVAKPGIAVSTKFVFTNLKLDEVDNHPDIDGIVSSIEDGDLQGIASKMGNVLETVTVKEYAVIENIKNIMIENGALNALMSGSGPTVFGLYEDVATAKNAFLKLKEQRYAKQMFITDVFNV